MVTGYRKGSPAWERPSRQEASHDPSTCSAETRRLLAPRHALLEHERAYEVVVLRRGAGATDRVDAASAVAYPRRERGNTSAVCWRSATALACLIEPLRRVLADRLQHPVAAVGEAEQALLDERLEGLEIGVADLLRRVQRAAAGEDGEPREEPPLLGGEEFVAPLDRRPERLLARVSVAAALQEIEAAGEAFEDLGAGSAPSCVLRRARPRAGGCRGGRTARRSRRSARAARGRRRE